MKSTKKSDGGRRFLSKDFAPELVGTANSGAKEGRRCAKLLRFVEGSITAPVLFGIGQPATIRLVFYERHCLSILA